MPYLLLSCFVNISDVCLINEWDYIIKSKLNLDFFLIDTFSISRKMHVSLHLFIYLFPIGKTTKWFACLIIRSYCKTLLPLEQHFHCSLYKKWQLIKCNPIIDCVFWTKFETVPSLNFWFSLQILIRSLIAPLLYNKIFFY